MNGDGDGDRAGTGTGTEVEANEGAQDENGNRSGYGAGTGTRVETRGCIQVGNEDGRGDGNESSSGDENGDEDGNGDGNEDGIGEGGEEAKKRKKPLKHCLRDQTLSLRTRHHLCRQRVTLAGARPFCSKGPGTCTRPPHRWDSRVQETGRSQRDRGRDRSWELSRGWKQGRGREKGRVQCQGRVWGRSRNATRTEVEVNEGAQDRNEDGGGDEADTETGVETRG